VGISVAGTATKYPFCGGEGQYGTYASVAANLDWINSAVAGNEPPFGLSTLPIGNFFCETILLYIVRFNLKLQNS
jgi:hypothetical protein